MSKNKSNKPDAQVDEAKKDNPVEDKPEQKADDTSEVNADKIRKTKSNSDKSEEAEAKRIMLQRDVSEVYKVGEYWFTHKPYADNHSKAIKAEIKTFKKQ